MRPGDHPEFFRLPPPEGRSRESTVVKYLDMTYNTNYEGSLLIYN